MSEELSKKKKYKLPFYLHLLQVLLFFFPSIYFQMNIIITGKMGNEGGGSVTSSPIMVGYQLFFILITFFILYKTIRILKHFNPEDIEKTAQINKKYRNISIGSITLVVCNAIIYPILFSTAANLMGIHSIELIPSIMMCLGESLMFGLFFYLLWLAGIEKFLHILPFTQNDVVLSFRAKNVIVAVFSVFALILLSTESLLYTPNNGIPLNEIFLKKSFANSTFWFNYYSN